MLAASEHKKKNRYKQKAVSMKEKLDLKKMELVKAQAEVQRMHQEVSVKSKPQDSSLHDLHDDLSK